VAKDKATNKEQQIRIQASGGLSQADIDKMVKDAEANAANDKRRRELVEAKNQADTLVYSTEKTLTDLGDKVSASDKTEVEAAIADLKGVSGSEDLEAIRAKTEALTKVSMKIGEQLYRQQQEQTATGQAGTGQPGTEGAAPGGAGNGGAGPDDKVVDADFTEV